MVVLYNLREVFNDSLQQKTFTLPAIKEKFLNIDFENNELIQNTETVYNGQQPALPFAASEVVSANVSHWRRLTVDSAECKPVYEVTIDVTDTNFNFRPGDTIGIIPQNLDDEVDIIIKHLDLESFVDSSYVININSGQKGAKIPPHVPVKSTLRYVLKYCVDLRGVIKKLFLLALSKYTTDETEKRTLEYLCSKEGSMSYTNHILNRNLCILDLFEIFKTCKPPIEVILEHLPRLLPRPYSIVNSALIDPNKLKFCFSVMDIGNGRKGLVTGCIERMLNKSSLENLVNNLNISENDDKTTMNTLQIYWRKNINQFSFPEDCCKPIILIGPGTGVAPYIGLLEERSFLNTKSDVESPIWLFFGCRNPELDYIYKDELKEFLSNKILNKLITAFSRVGNSEVKYIQDALLLNGEEVTRLIKNGAYIYVCGDVKNLSVQVKETLVKCLIEFSDCAKEEAETFMSDIQKEKRYVVDSWN